MHKLSDANDGERELAGAQTATAATCSAGSASLTPTHTNSSRQPQTFLAIHETIKHLVHYVHQKMKMFKMPQYTNSLR